MYAQQRFSEWSANSVIIFYYGRIYIDIFMSFLVLNDFYYGYLTSALEEILPSFLRASWTFSLLLSFLFLLYLRCPQCSYLYNI